MLGSRTAQADSEPVDDHVAPALGCASLAVSPTRTLSSGRGPLPSTLPSSIAATCASSVSFLIGWMTLKVIRGSPSTATETAHWTLYNVLCA